MTATETPTASDAETATEHIPKDPDFLASVLVGAGGVVFAAVIVSCFGLFVANHALGERNDRVGKELSESYGIELSDAEVSLVMSGRGGAPVVVDGTEYELRLGGRGEDDPFLLTTPLEKK
jgi:hypothetical protein